MRNFVLFMLLFGGAVAAYAGSSPVGPVEFTFVAWNNGEWQNGYPYVIQATNDPTGSILFAMCDDYFHGGQPGDMWSAYITQLGSDNLSMARFNNISVPNALGPLLLYDEAGWILLQTLDTPSNQFQAMNYAVWYLFDPSQTPCNGACQVWLANAENAASEGFPNTDFDRVYIVTPVDQHDPDPNGPQEFLALGSNSGLIPDQGAPTVPEPSTFILIGSGAAAIAGRRLLT